MSFLESLGKGVLDSLESKARLESRNKKLPEELREQYGQMGDAFGNMKDMYFGENDHSSYDYYDDDDDY